MDPTPTPGTNFSGQKALLCFSQRTPRCSCVSSTYQWLSCTPQISLEEVVTFLARSGVPNELWEQMLYEDIFELKHEYDEEQCKGQDKNGKVKVEAGIFPGYNRPHA